MPVCILRVDGAEFDPDAFLASSGLVADRTYRQGERRRGNAVHTTSGLAALLSDVDDYGQQVQDAIRYLGEHHDTLTRLRGQSGVTVMLDFGCALPVKTVAARYFRLPLALIELCANLGIEIELSVYATK